MDAQRILGTPGRAWRRVRPTLWPDVQTAAAAGGAWFLAHRIPGHTQPLFAPIAAVVAMTAGRGRRGRAAVELILGVTAGIVLADLFVRVVGVGPWQLILVVLATMTIANALGAPAFVVNQSAVWSVIVVAFTHGRLGLALNRLEDALVGGGIALVLAQLLFPLRPLELVEEAERESRRQLDEVLREVAAALRERDEERAAQAVRRADDLDPRRLQEALALGRAAARATPRGRGERRRLDEHAAAAEELRRAARELRVLALGAARLLRSAGAPPEQLVEAVERLAEHRREAAVAAARGDGDGGPAADLVAQQLVSLARALPFDGQDEREDRPP